jgi:hypothetical protein
MVHSPDSLLNQNVNNVPEGLTIVWNEDGNHSNIVGIFQIYLRFSHGKLAAAGLFINGVLWFRLI